MRHPRLTALAAALALAAPGLASADVSPGSGWSFTLSVWGGVSRYDVLGLEHGVGSLDRDDLDGELDAYGLSGVLRLGWLDLGALYEGSFRRSTDSFVVTPLVGFKWDLTEMLRLDVLGELGGHRISNLGTDAESVWLPYVGVRPSLSLRLPLGFTRLVFSATPFARWDLVKKEVTTTGATGPVRYDVGGSTFGVVGGIGLEI
jgi:hypothetical protein